MGLNMGTCYPIFCCNILLPLQGRWPDDLDQREKADKRELGWEEPTQEPAPPQGFSLGEVINFFQGETCMMWFFGTCSQIYFAKCEGLKIGGF